MCIFKKVNELREEFHNSELKKNGKGYGYNFFELADFLPLALQLCKKHGIFTQVSFTDDYAKMDVVDIANPDSKYEILSPMSEANLKNCHPVQNLGAVQTYTRRYLWMALLEVVEHDAIDGAAPDDDKPAPQKKPKNDKRTPKVEPEKPEPKKAEEPKVDKTANYRKHFDKEVGKINKTILPKVIEQTESAIGKKWDALSITDMKTVLKDLAKAFPKLGLEVD